MSKEMAVVLLGVVVVVVPYLGIPISWRTVLIILAGFAITGMGFLLRGEALSRGSAKTEHNPFIESGATAPAQEE